MKLFNYLRVLGKFTNGYQPIKVPKEPSDRQVRKMLEEAFKEIDASWARRAAALGARQLKDGEPLDLEAEKAAFYPKESDGHWLIQLQFLQDFMVKKIASLQNNTSIHNTAEVKELLDVFEEYGVETYSHFDKLTLTSINWSAKAAQKPKLMVHAKDKDEEVCIRFEAAGELCQKMMMALLELNVKPEQVFDLSVEAVDPAIAKNAKAGKQVAEPGKYVNHNLKLTVNGKYHTGHPKAGQKFVQKPTIEFMETLFQQTRMSMQAK